MDLTQLEMFNAVAEAGSITQAAAKVHRVPSNLTNLTVATLKFSFHSLPAHPAPCWTVYWRGN